VIKRTRRPSTWTRTSQGRSTSAPRDLGPHVRRYAPAGVALTGVAVMLLLGVMGSGDLSAATTVLWRPLLAITSIMITTGAAQSLGVIDRVAEGLFPKAHGSTSRLFAVAFVLSAAVAAVLNNDSAILLLVPIIVTLLRRLYPQHPQVVLPFMIVVFSAAGVAPMMMSNPMNLIVAEYARIDFNTYARHMIPVAIAGWAVAFVMLRLVLRRGISSVPHTDTVAAVPAPWTGKQKQGLVLLVAVLGAYPLMSLVDGPVWAVAAAGAVAGIALCAAHREGSPRELVTRSVSWEVLLFLVAVSTAAIGLRNAGVVDWLAGLYANWGSPGVGVMSAIGSALINNQPMSLINVLAIDTTPGAGHEQVFAALIGGDLGPRLLPWGSLAGLLWYSTLQRYGLHVSFLRFVAVGTAVTVPSLAVSLLVHAALS
jgi:arsenical pump membrane protein